ncbi:hypothetical protein Q5P01_019341 [Channa striata]|uniref:Uncharacterized protein n=1 Tax=Channa striata TaxID=64152 RepID=A0AA88M190_CHASR|nr:hypothetical protein Q5P01_019341 [Channa striata]
MHLPVSPSRNVRAISNQRRRKHGLRTRAAPADSATARDDSAPPLATNHTPNRRKGRQGTFAIGCRLRRSMRREGAHLSPRAGHLSWKDAKGAGASE